MKAFHPGEEEYEVVRPDNTLLDNFTSIGVQSMTVAHFWLIAIPTGQDSGGEVTQLLSIFRKLL